MLESFFFFVSFVVRLVFAFKQPINFDTYGHLYFASEVGTQKAGPFGAIRTKVAESCDFYHPFLWHWLIAKFPVQSVLKWQKAITCIIDATIATFLFCFLVRAGFELTEATIGFCLYLFTPIFFSSFSIGPRVNSLTPRLASEGLGFCLSMLFIMGHGMSDELWFLATTFVATCLLIISKFGVQVVWFLLTILAVLTADLAPVLILIASNILATLISRGQFFMALHRQFQHLSSYFTRHREGKMAITNRNNLDWIRGWRTMGAGAIAQKLVIENSYTAVTFKFPLVLLFLLLLANDLATYGLRPLTMAETLSISAITLFVLTSLPAFLPLGEAERYLIYVTPAIIFACLHLALESNYLFLIYWLLAWGVSFWVAEVCYSAFRQKPSAKNEAEKKVIAYLNNEAKPGGVLSVPYHAVGVYRIMLQSGRAVIYPHLMASDIMPDFIDRFEKHYPFIDLDKADELYREYRIRYVVIDSEKVSSFGNLENASWRRLPNDFAPFLVFERID